MRRAWLKHLLESDLSKLGHELRQRAKMIVMRHEERLLASGLLVV